MRVFLTEFTKNEHYYMLDLARSFKFSLIQ